MNARVLLIDNYDSFSFNLVQACRIVGAEVAVYRNDMIDPVRARALDPTHLIVSPGPGRPEDAGVCVAMISAFAGVIPVLGVCLGHQCIVLAFGGVVGAAERLMHGKASPIHHDGTGIYLGLPAPFPAGRYHSLAASEADLPESLQISGRSSTGEVMGVRHRRHRVDGVQFHPESILTPAGERLLANFLRRPCDRPRGVA